MLRISSPYWQSALTQYVDKGYRLKANKALDEIPVLELRDVTCHMGSHSVTCHPTQVNGPRLNPASKLVLDLPTPEGWKAELT